MGSQVTHLLAVATILSLAASACNSVSLPTTPTVQPALSVSTPEPPPGPTPSPTPST
jgi:hypothetical protein